MTKRPQAVKAAKAAAEAGDAARASPPALCRAHPRPRPALCLRLREQDAASRDGSWYRLARSGGAGTGRADDAAAMTTLHRLWPCRAMRKARPRPHAGRRTHALPAWITRPAPREHGLPRLIRPSDALDMREPPALSPLEGARPLPARQCGACASGAAAGDRAGPAPRGGDRLCRRPSGLSSRRAGG